MKHLLAAVALSWSVSAMGAPPATIERESYGNWLSSIRSVVSPYYDPLFQWYEEQLGLPLPSEVASDPDLLFVSVERPLRETIEAEELGDVEKGVTYGLESYGILDASLDLVMETILFRWGKPVGATEGTTFPVDPVYSYREERLKAAFGPGSYRAETTLRGGGIAKEQNDVSTLLVRGNRRQGYVIVAQFFGPNGKTASTSSMSIMMVRPLPDGRVDYRVSGRYTGQSYAVFGIEFGRRNYGFNLTRIRGAQKDFFAMVQELKNTGKLPERRPRRAAPRR